MNLPERVRFDLIALAKSYDIDKMVLFGSRAREDNNAKSDVDIAVYGCVHFASSPSSN